MNKEQLYDAGEELAARFCEANGVPMPLMIKLYKDHPDSLMRRYYECIGSCAFYRPTTIHIAVAKCAHYGMGGRAWSWPAYVIDRTPYGVIQHELGHHVDHWFSASPLKEKDDLFSYRIYQQSREKPLTGYLGTDNESQTFFKKWFAENFRIFATNPDLSRSLRPKFFEAMLAAGLKTVVVGRWDHVLREHTADGRIMGQAMKKIEAERRGPAPVTPELF